MAKVCALLSALVVVHVLLITTNFNLIAQDESYSHFKSFHLFLETLLADFPRC